MTSPDDIAIAILGWLAGEPDLLGRFMAITGADTTTLRSMAGDPGFMAGLVDFLMSHEPTLLAFCAATDIKPEEVVRAHQMLSGPVDY